MKKQNFIETATAALTKAGLDVYAELPAILRAVVPDPIARLVIEEFDAQQIAELTRLLEGRCARIPFSQLTGTVGFWTLDLNVTPDVLTPRPDSETVIRVALARCKNPATLMDLGTGSGCLLLALLSEYQNAIGTGVDVSAAALAVAMGNNPFGMRANFQQANWFAPDFALPAADLIVSNPPYIVSAEIEKLEPEVRLHEPHLALDGGADGLAAYQQLIPLCFAALNPAGLCVMEIGFDQGDAVQALFKMAGFNAIQLKLDYGQNPRVVSGVKP